jgi:hypothetical protein
LYREAKKHRGEFSRGKRPFFLSFFLPPIFTSCYLSLSVKT